MASLVAVYGTLKRGCSNCHLLEEALFVGIDALDCISLYDIGPYPGAREQPSSGIAVEIFEVTDQQLALLDELEDYLAHASEQGMYTRKRFATCFGDAWVYLYNLPVDGLQKISEGSWPLQRSAG